MFFFLLGRSGLDTAGHKKQNLSELEPRKPFSPISCKDASKVKVTEVGVKHETLQKTFQNHTLPFVTPSKATTALGEENKVPAKNIIPMLPFTPSAQMQTTMTPAIKAMMIPEEEEVIEYSFEERRAGFVLPRSHVKTMI